MTRPIEKLHNETAGLDRAYGDLERALEVVAAADNDALLALAFRGQAIHHNVDRMLGWVQMADNKGLIALTFQGAIIAGLAILADPVRAVVQSQAYPWRKWLVFVLVAVFLACFFLSIWKLLRTISPRIYKHSDTFDPSQLFFYGAISTMRIDEFQERMHDVTVHDVHEGLNSMAYTTAHIAMEKFRNLRVAYECLGLQMLVFVITILVIVI